MYEIDLDDRSTWRNYPEPPIPSYLKDAVKTLGGRHSSGKSFLRLVWMPSIKQLFGEEEWPLYINTATDPRIWTAHRLERVLRYADGTPVPGPEGQPRREVRYAPDMDVVTQVLAADKELGEGWTYIPELKWEYICHQRFCVEQFFPTEMWEACGYSSPERWEADRYDEFIHPITGLIYPRRDMLGPYPAPGRYEIAASELISETIIKDEQGRKIGTEYRTPGDWLLEEIKRMKGERESFSDTPLNRAAFLRAKGEEVERSRRKHYDELSAETLDILKPIAHTFSDKLARVYQTSQRQQAATKHSGIVAG